MVTSKARNLNDISLATWSRLVSATLDKKTSDAFYYDTRKEDNATLWKSRHKSTNHLLPVRHPGSHLLPTAQAKRKETQRVGGK